MRCSSHCQNNEAKRCPGPRSKPVWCFDGRQGHEAARCSRPRSKHVWSFASCSGHETKQCSGPRPAKPHLCCFADWQGNKAKWYCGSRLAVHYFCFVANWQTKQQCTGSQLAVQLLWHLTCKPERRKMQQSTRSLEFVPTANCYSICQGKLRIGSALARRWLCDRAFEGQQQQKCFDTDKLGYRQITQRHPASSAHQHGNASMFSGDLRIRTHPHPLQPKAVRPRALQFQYPGHLKIQLQANYTRSQSATGDYIYIAKSWTKAKPGPTLVALTITFSRNRTSSYSNRANCALDYQSNRRLIFKSCLNDLWSFVVDGIADICLSARTIDVQLSVILWRPHDVCKKGPPAV